MSTPSGTTPFHEWHSTLRARDDAAHAAEQEWAETNGRSALEERLRIASAELRAMRAGLAFRDQLLAEQARALRERDALIARLEDRRPGNLSRSRTSLRRLIRPVASRARRYGRGVARRLTWLRR